MTDPVSPALRGPRRPAEGERLFTDDDGRLWSASEAMVADGGVLVFMCVSDPRSPVRAIAEVETRQFTAADDDLLRRWLSDAPRIGRLEG